MSLCTAPPPPRRANILLIYLELISRDIVVKGSKVTFEILSTLKPFETEQRGCNCLCNTRLN